MNINWDLVLILYGFGAVITFISYLVFLHKQEDRDVNMNTLQLLGIFLLCICVWWLEIILRIGVILYKWLSKPIIKKRKDT